MREWWNQRAPREQWILGSGAVAAGLIGFFLLVWEPLYAAFARENAALQDARELTTWLTDIRPRVASSGGARPSVTNRSLLSVVDSSAKQSGLGAQVKRIQPEGETRALVWIENAPLNQVLQWMQSLHERHQVAVTNLNMDRGNQAGTASARLTLERN